MGYWNTPLPDHIREAKSKFHGREVKYSCPREIRYFSFRYDKWVTVPEGYPSDGATGAVDLDTIGWWVHDVLCDRGTFDDRTPCTNHQASAILHDILLRDGHWFFARRWYLATLLFGGGKARENGIFKLKRSE